MIASLSLVLSMALMSNSLEEPAWQKTFDQIAPHMTQSEYGGLSQQTAHKKLNSLLKELDLQPKNGSKTTKKRPGFYTDSFDTVVPVGGTREGVLVVLRYGMGNPENINQAAYGLFLGDGTPRTGQCIDQAKKEENLIFPQSVVLCKDKLVIAGLYGWFGNGAQVEVRGYQKNGSQWRFLAKKTAPDESWGSSGLKLSKDKTQILPLTFESRAYPIELDACHATAHRTSIEKWKIVDGQPKLMWKKLRDTPYNTLDELYGAIRNKDMVFIQSHSLDGSVTAKLLALHPRSKSGTPQIKFPHGICDGDSKVIGLTNLKTTFHFRRYHNRWIVWKLSPISECK